MHELPDNAPYLLQCIRLGMLLQSPEELDVVEPWHFGDPVLRGIVSHLKERRAAHANGKTSFKRAVELADYLQSLGCDEGIQSVEDARSAIRDRVEVDGAFVRAVERLSEVTRMTVDGNLPSSAKRRFAERVIVDWDLRSE